MKYLRKSYLLSFIEKVSKEQNCFPCQLAVCYQNQFFPSLLIHPWESNNELLFVHQHLTTSAGCDIVCVGAGRNSLLSIICSFISIHSGVPFVCYLLMIDSEKSKRKCFVVAEKTKVIKKFKVIKGTKVDLAKSSSIAYTTL